MHEQLVAPLSAAVSAVLAEMAGAEAVVQSVYRQPLCHTTGEVSAVLRLALVADAVLVLSCPKPTAQALAQRVLAGVPQPLDDSMIGDCVGELANVIAGQAKALLAGTPHHFTFSPPTILAGAGLEISVESPSGGFVIGFQSDAGEFALQFAGEL
jgi:chemotaxis protein CheX